MDVKNLIEWIIIPITGWLLYKTIDFSNWKAMATEKLSQSEKNDSDLNMTNQQLREVVIRLDKIIVIHEEKHKVTENRLKKLEAENAKNN